ncbi:hypothetical protein [Clostridium sp. SM-530-WT-3G]|uniref:hypothetical protein n=1 Tax=Clostridium sp. SM-530-WT-3G TaxID=2725303 RepID=UPI00145DDE63|nr:hypothetical protein [Clostridium sp. SM-530-WT-3G]NME83478.1 hypothetical protein [Clostridium sp. SM-530-WT-3G]
MKGSLVIEAAIGIMILSIAAAFAVNCHIESSKFIKQRIINEDVMRNIVNLEREIKYNLNKNQLDDLFENGELHLKYDENLGRSLTDKKIYELEKGNDIVIKIINQSEEKIEFRVYSNIEKDCININIADEFDKSWWTCDE